MKPTNISKAANKDLTTPQKNALKETKRPPNPHQQSQEGNIFQNTHNQGYGKDR